MPKLHGWGPGTAGAADFEALMRRRRFRRCVLRAQHAIEAGADEDACAALDEARQLSPDAPEVAVLEARLTEPRNAVAMSPVSGGPDELPLVLDGGGNPSDLDEPEDGAYTVDPGELVRSDLALVAQGRRGAKPLVAAGLAVVLLTLMVAGGGRRIVEVYEILNPRSLGKDSGQTLTRLADIKVSVGRAQAFDLPGVAEGEKASPRQGKPGVRQATSAPTRRTSTAVNRPEADAGRSEPRGRPSRLPSGKGALQAVAPRSIPRPASQADPRKMPAMVSTESRIVVPESMVSAAPALVPVATTGVNATLALDSIPLPPAASRTSEEGRRDEDAQIRAVLRRYESAYNRLDASAASSVWPGVNRAALDRAFGGLLSQWISLGSCDIMKIDDRRLATCAGNAVWEPRVGGGKQNAQRYWAFDLRKIPDGWRIEHVRVR